MTESPIPQPLAHNHLRLGILASDSSHINVDVPVETYSDKDKIIAPFYDIELKTGVIISTLIMPRKEWENRLFLTPFQNNINKEGITL